jgi:hypothetical protein
MHDDGLSKFERNGKAAMAAGLAALVLAGIGFWATANDIGGAVCIGSSAAMLGSVVGVLGASARSLNRASFIGAGIAGLFVAFPVELSGSLLEPVSERLWFFAAVCSLGSILAQIGAVVGGAPANWDERARSMQFTLRQLLAFFIPIAIYFGYVSAHMRK